MVDDPFALFAEWFAEAEKSEPNDPQAMAFATADAQARPSVRMVLLRDAGRAESLMRDHVASIRAAFMGGPAA